MKDFITKESLEDTHYEYLEEYFINTLEYGGTPITKDNVEDLFDNWLEDLTDEELTTIFNK